MLILIRKVGEKMVIDDHIQLTVVEIRGKRVRLGVTVPRDVPIRRTDLKSFLAEPLAAEDSANATVPML